MQDKPQRGEAEHTLGLLPDQLDQRGVEPLKFARLEVILDLPRRARADRDLVRLREAARGREVEQRFKLDQRMRARAQPGNAVEPTLDLGRVDLAGGQIAK